MSAPRLLSRAVVLAVALGVAMLGGVVGMQLWPDAVIDAAERLIFTARGLGGVGLVVFALLQAFIALSGILPASLLGIAAGTLYGVAAGFLLAAVSTMAGAVLAFLLSRSAFRPAVERVCARRPRLRNLDALVGRDGWKLVCLLRLSPVMPFAPTSYLLGLSSIGLRDYLLGTLASLPALLGYVFLGTLADAGLSVAKRGAGPWAWLALGLGAAATLALTVHLGRIVVRLGLFGASAEVTAHQRAGPPLHSAHRP
jgi:uncharacterized membrane protein YdjX (TVP38/TMEM64 family)